MENWQFDFDWLQTRHWIKDRFGKQELPDLKSILFLIGLQEVGHWEGSIQKETKQDYMHVASCVLLSEDGYYAFHGIDADGWPHFNLVQALPFKEVAQQERYLKEKVINYFKKLIDEEE